MKRTVRKPSPEKRGGYRSRAGRPKGSGNKVSNELRMRAVRNAKMLPLEFLLKVMNDEATDQDTRIKCAKYACDYVHPKLQAIVKADGSDVERFDWSQVSDETLKLIVGVGTLFEAEMAKARKGSTSSNTTP